mgnify:CR=1 FL=1
MPNPKSTAQIAGHPLHPMLVPFPIAFFVATFACDLAYRSNFWFQILESLLMVATSLATLGVVFFQTDELAGWDANELVAQLGMRDLRQEIGEAAADAQELSPEHDEKLGQLEDAYWRELEEHGVAHLVLLRGGLG